MRDPWDVFDFVVIGLSILPATDCERIFEELAALRRQVEVLFRRLETTAGKSRIGRC